MPAQYIDINKALVDRCRNGDGIAQRELYYLYAKQMFNVGMRIVNNTADAEDILQESFVEAFKFIHEFRGDSSFGAWLKRIVVNRSINNLKKRRLTLFEQVPDTEIFEPDASAEDDVQYEVKKVHSAMLALPPGYRLVLSLYLLEGYDHAEIAQIMNITESTSKSQYNRAKAKLKAQLKGENDEG